VWRRRGEAASARLSAAPYSVYHGLYSEAVVSSTASAVALVEVGRFREAVEYVQKAAKTLYEGAREVFEQVKVTAQRLVELFVEAVTRVLAWINEHRAYLFLIAAAAAGVVALSFALNLWGLVELEKLVHAAVGAPFVAGLADAGGKAAERFKTLAERWRVDENEKQKIEEIINEVINAPLKGERLFSKLTRLENLSPPLAELRKALKHVKGEVVQDAAVAAALVLYKTLVKNAEAIGEWAGWYKWARGLVERQVFTVTAEEVKKLSGSQRGLEEVAEEVIEELNRVLVLYSQSDFYKERPDLLNKLKQHLEVDFGEAEGLAEARSDELSEFGGVNMGTKVYAALLSAARGGIYGHIATLFMGEGALADIVMSAPVTAYEKARKIAGARGETVDPSRSRRRAKAGGIAGGRGGAVDLPHVEAADWGDRAASVLLRFLIGYGEIDPQLLSGAGEVSLKFRLVKKDGKKDDEKKRVEGGVERGFQVFRAYGGVEAPVGELWIGDVAYFKIGKEELRRLVEEARKTAPDLSGMDTSRQYVEWRATDVTTVKRQIVAGTVHSWQLRWYFGLLGGPKSFSGSASVTKEGIKLFVTAYWPRESENQILKKSSWLESLLGHTVNNWRELVDAINWSWVLKRVEELIGALKPWIGHESANDAEREGLVRRMLGELELLANFAEARRGMDDGRWKEVRAVRLAEAVEALSGGRIKGDHAKGLAQVIIYYAEGHKKKAEGLIEDLAKVVGVSREEVQGVVERVLSGEDPYVYCLARDCARDEMVRKFVAPALELIMLDKALNDNDEFKKEEALLYFGEMYATAVAGDGSAGQRSVVLAVGGELGGGAALLRLATLHLFNQLLPDELKFGVRTYVERDRYYYIAAHGENATKLKRLLAVTAPSAGGGYLSEKFKKFMKEARVEVRLDNIRLTPSGRVAADLTISEGGAAVKYYLYLQNSILLDFQSTDRSRAELAARLLRLAGVSAEVSKAGNRGVWHVVATTDMLAAGREELRNALAEIVRKAVERGWMDEKKAEFWLKKLERGRTVREGLPKYLVRLDKGALEVTFGSPNPNSITRETQRLKEMGLVEDWHFTVKMPEEDRNGYLYIPREGLAYAAWLSVKGSEKQRELATKFVSYILERAREEGEDVYRKALEVVEEGRARGSLTLKGFEKKVEVNGKTYVVKVKGGEAVEEDRGGRKLLRMRITAEVGRVEGEHIVDPVVREYKITYGRYGADNAAVGYAVAKASAPGGREADAERFSALIEALTGRRPGVYRTRDGKIKMMCYGEHLEDFRRYAELTDAIEEWLRKTRR
jgi:hypothetical protein